MVPAGPYGAQIPTIYVDSMKARDVEAFASKLSTVGASQDINQDMLPYMNMDASALLTYFAGSNVVLLKELQDAVMNRDMNEFLQVLRRSGAKSNDDIADLESAFQRGDRGRLANVIRRITQKDFQRMEEQATLEAKAAQGRGWECGSRSDPILMTTRRMIDTTFVVNQSPPAYPDKFKSKDMSIKTYSAMHLGSDHDKWEEQLTFHPMVYDCANASMSVMEEVKGYGYLDGRNHEAEPRDWRPNPGEHDYPGPRFYEKA